MDRPTLISMLDIGADPTTGDLRRARRVAARRFHPDRLGDVASPLAEINAACDEWIAELRRPPPAAPLGAEPAPPPATPPPARPVRLRPIDVVATIGLVIVIAVVVVALLGFSPGSVATGLLLGAGAAGVFAVVLHRLAAGRR